MPKFCFNVFTNCTDPEREDEFNRWYSRTHIPDLSKAHGFQMARRFVNDGADPAHAKYWTQYEFEADSQADALRSFLEHALEGYKEGRVIDCFTDAPAEMTQAVWVEIDPETVAPLEPSALDYPTEPPDNIVQALESFRELSVHYAQ